MADPDDEQLVRLAQKGGLPGQLAFEKLVDRHQTWLVRFLNNLVGADGEDVAQDAFVRAFVAIRDCGDPKRFRPWLRVLARNLAFNHRRNASTRSRYEDRAAQAAPSATQNPSSQVEMRQELKTVLSQLSYPYREVMVLRYVEQLELREIAATLEIGESAAKMRLARARKEFAAIHHKVTGR